MTATTRTLDPESPWMLALLAMLVAIGPLTIDMYLPALPGMVTAFNTNVSSGQLTISSYLTGFALFHLVCGPLADRYGRKPILIGGIALFSLAGIACAMADSIEQLILFRFFQGLGACVGPTLGRAITRDLFGPSGAARALSLIAMLMALAPAIAPTLGGFMLQFLPWSSIFFTLAGYGLLTIVLIALYLPESMPAPQSLHLPRVFANYKVLLRNSLYRTTTLASSMMYAGLISFLSASSFVFINMYGVAPQYFGLLFLPTVGGYVVGSGVSARLSANHSSEWMMLAGAKLGCLSSMTMVLSAEFTTGIAGILVPMAFYSASLGLVLPHAMATALKQFPQIAGTASALMGFIQMAISAGAGALVGAQLSDTPRPMTITICLVTAIALLLMTRIPRPTNTELE